MGKGFLCSEAIKGQDLGDIIQQACQRAVGSSSEENKLIGLMLKLPL